VRLSAQLTEHFFCSPGITQKQMTTKFRGEAIYSAEQDVRFPQLTVGETLTFAAEARAVSIMSTHHQKAGHSHLSNILPASPPSRRSDTQAVCPPPAGCCNGRVRYQPHSQYSCWKRLCSGCIRWRVRKMIDMIGALY
jgi:hypothetical protein